MEVTLDNTTLRLAVTSVVVVDAELLVECTVKYVPTATAITTTTRNPFKNSRLRMTPHRFSCADRLDASGAEPLTG